jgi:acetyl esterase/lipase
VHVKLTTILVGVAKCNPHDSLFSPLHLTDYSRLGPIFYQVASMDIWKDSALFYCDKVEKAGGKVKLELYPGVPHTWWSMYPQLSINKEWAKNLVNGVEWLLGQSEQKRASSKL